MQRFLVRLTVVAAVVGLTAAGADAAPPPVSFAPATIYSAGPDPFSVAAADLNADGKLDLAVANEANQTVSVILGRGDGSFGARTTYSAGTGPWSVAAADLNGDGKPDLAVADLNGNAVSVLLGEGDGSFQARTSDAVGTFPKSVTVADFNGDGKPDLAVANSGSNTVSVLLGNGDGTFHAQTSYATGNGPASAAAADLNGDGKPDLAVANSGSNTVSVLLGNGDGSFRPATSYGVSGSQPDSVAAADLNGDGKPDLAVSSFGGDTVSVLLGNGDGSFGPRTSYPAGHGPRWVTAVDLNGDGNADLAVADETDGTQTCCAGTVSVLLGNGDGSFQPRTPYVAVSPGPGTAADLNGDGTPDLAVANETGAAVSVLLNTTHGIAPVVNIAGGSPVAEGGAFSGSGSFTDPDSSSWTASVDYGDGTGLQQLPLVGNSFALQHVYDDSGTYTLTVTVTDDGGTSGSVSTQVTVANVPPSATLTVDSPVTEGSTSTLTLAGASDPSNADTQAGFRYSFACDGDPASLATSYATADAGSTRTCAFADNGSYPVAARIVDKDGGESTYSAVVSVTNVAPTVGAISAPADPVALGTDISIGAPFSDAGVLDTHTALVDWGDGTTSPAVVAEANGSGTATADHAYAVPGVYTLTLTVTDNDGTAGQATYAYVVAYDPSGASVRGSGTILSPAGAYVADPSLTGEATFGFDAAYKHGATTPDGRTRFRFKSADFTFVSTSYDWLVVAGPRAQFKGAGSVNGGDGYGFLLTATDGDVTGGGGTDKFRIKIWNIATGAVVYDNQMGAGDTADASEAISKGDITIK